MFIFNCLRNQLWNDFFQSLKEGGFWSFCICHTLGVEFLLHTNWCKSGAASMKSIVTQL